MTVQIGRFAFLHSLMNVNVEGEKKIEYREINELYIIKFFFSKCGSVGMNGMFL